MVARQYAEIGTRAVIDTFAELKNLRSRSQTVLRPQEVDRGTNLGRIPMTCR